MMEPTIGKHIADLRKAKNITQTQLAEYLFLVPQTVSKWEAGNGTPDISLLPRIADFFGISLDDLFGRPSLEHAKDLVLKYSVLRDDHCFIEAFDCLQSQLQTIDSALKLGKEDPVKLEREKTELEAYKMHLLLQQSWESARRALVIAENTARRTGDIRFRLQRVQLLVELGHSHFILSECKTQFQENPCLDTLHLYFEALLLLARCEIVTELQTTDASVKALMMPPSPENAPIWLQCAQAAAESGDVEATAGYENAISKCGSKQEEYDFLWLLAKLYCQKGLREKCDALKPRLSSLLPEIDSNPYSAAQRLQAIENL